MVESGFSINSDVDLDADLDADLSGFSHIPVLSQEVIQGLAVHTGGYYLDLTVGGGGHSRLILAAADNVKLTASDRDELAIAAAQQNLAEYGKQVEFIQQNFANYHFPPRTYDGILADLGVSSHHLDQPERGFSFRHKANLDMRMDRQQSWSAADLVNEWEESELADIFFKYGEERLSRRIAKRIIERRPFYTTTELAGRSLLVFHPNIVMGESTPQLAFFKL